MERVIKKFRCPGKIMFETDFKKELAIISLFQATFKDKLDVILQEFTTMRQLINMKCLENTKITPQVDQCLQIVTTLLLALQHQILQNKKQNMVDQDVKDPIQKDLMETSSSDKLENLLAKLVVVSAQNYRVMNPKSKVRFC